MPIFCLNKMVRKILWEEYHEPVTKKERMMPINRKVTMMMDKNTPKVTIDEGLSDLSEEKEDETG